MGPLVAGLGLSLDTLPYLWAIFSCRNLRMSLGSIFNFLSFMPLFYTHQ